MKDNRLFFLFSFYYFDPISITICLFITQLHAIYKEFYREIWNNIHTFSKNLRALEQRSDIGENDVNTSK